MSKQGLGKMVSSPQKTKPVKQTIKPPEEIKKTK
jgi:hypothetical protein